MVSGLNSEASGLGSSSGQGHCVAFFVKTLYSHSASPHPRVEMGTSELIVKLEVTLRLVGKSNADSR